MVAFCPRYARDTRSRFNPSTAQEPQAMYPLFTIIGIVVVVLAVINLIG